MNTDSTIFDGHALSPPVNLGFLTRRLLRAAMEHVRLEGGHAPGPDGLRHEDVFGHGPGSPQYKDTITALSRQKRAYCFGWTRSVEVLDKSTCKPRVICVPNIMDRIMLHALEIAARRYLPTSAIGVSRNGLDGRWSIVRAAVALRSGAVRWAVYFDIESAFPSLKLEAALGAEAGAAMPPEILTALIGSSQHFVPSGIGVPLGLPTSSLLLDMALAGPDERMKQLGSLVFRYADDYLVLDNDPDLMERVLEVAERELGVCGLAINKEKTTSAIPLSWLAHEIPMFGNIDLAEETATRIKEVTNPTAKWAMQRHFVLAARGPRFRLVFGGADSGPKEGPVFRTHRLKGHLSRASDEAESVKDSFGGAKGQNEAPNSDVSSGDNRQQGGEVEGSFGPFPTERRMHPTAAPEAGRLIGPVVDAADDRAGGDGREGRGP